MRTTFHTARGKYVGQTDECPSCAPGTFEPQWQRAKIVPAYEAYPNQFRQVPSEDGGVCYVATDEARADEEARILRPNPDDVAARERAIQRRREWARTRPRKLTASQIEAINARRDELLSSPMARVAGVRPPHE